MARFDKLTLKSQEAVQAAQDMAAKRHHQQMDTEHLLLALVEQTDGVVLPLLKKLGADPGRIRADIEEALNKLPKVEGLVQTYLSPRLNKLFDKAEQEAERLKDEYVSTEHLLIAAADGDDAARDILARHGVTKDRIFTVLVDIRGSPASDGPESRGQVSGLDPLRQGPDRLGQARQARSGDRPGRGDPASDTGAFPAYQEQSCADRRAGRGQDCNRRRPGPADRHRRRARRAQEQACGRPGHGCAHRRRKVPRRVRGPVESGA